MRIALLQALLLLGGLALLHAAAACGCTEGRPPVEVERVTIVGSVPVPAAAACPVCPPTECPRGVSVGLTPCFDTCGELRAYASRCGCATPGMFADGGLLP